MLAVDKPFMNPFPDQTPHAILNREYLMTRITWTAGTTGTRIPFPGSLFGVPAIAKALATFYYFRADLQVSIRLNSTPYHKGMLMVNFVHDWKTIGPSVVLPNLKQLSCHNPVLLNFSSADCCDIRIPRLTPGNFLPIRPAGVIDPQDTSIGFLALNPIVTLEAPDDASQSIQVSVFARFLMPMCAGFLASQSASKHAKFTTADQKDKTDRQVVVSSNKPNFFSPITEVVNDASSAITSLAGFFGSFSGLFDKPRNLAAASPMFIDQFRHVPNADGLDPSIRLSMYQKNALAQNIFPKDCITSNITFNAMASIPSLQQVVSMTNVANYFWLTAHPMVELAIDSDNERTPDFLSTVTSTFKQWRGGMKFLLIFVCDAFQTARIRISYVIDSTEGTQTFGGDYPSIVADVKGTTYVPFSVPFLYATPYRDVNENTSDEDIQPKIKVELLTEITTATTDTLTCVVWRSGAEDLQFSQLVPTIFGFPSPPKLKSQCDVGSYFSKKFKPLGCDCSVATELGFVTPETPAFVSDACKRYVPCANYRFPISRPDPTAPTVEAFKYPYYWYGSLFRYFRGSERYTVVRETSTDTIKCGLADDTDLVFDYGRGVTFMTPNQHSITLEKPYYCTKSYFDLAPNVGHTDVTNQEVPVVYIAPTTGVEILTSLGDDAEFFHLLWPPDLTPAPAKVLNKDLSVTKTTRVQALDL
jgi:hypothetical protein